MSRRAAGLAVIQPDKVPHGPLHLLIDSLGLKVYGGRPVAGGQTRREVGARKSNSKAFHLAVDVENGMIVAHTLTDQGDDDLHLRFPNCWIRSTSRSPG